MKMFFFIFCLFFSGQVFASKKLCEIFDFIKCVSNGNFDGRSSGASYPNQSSSSSFNPSAVPVNKGFGVEFLQYDGYTNIFLLSGTGRVGAAVSSATNEDVFFGNVAIGEEEESYRSRKQARKIYKNEKYSFTTAFSLYSKKKNYLGLGVVAKFNNETNRLNGGIGVSGIWKFLSAGISVFEDSFRDSVTGADRFYTSISAGLGLKLPYTAIDYSFTQSDTDPVTTIHLLSGTLFYKKFMATYGYRIEESNRDHYSYRHDRFEDKRKKTFQFIGLQYAISRTFMVGIYENFYLVDELSLGLSVFL